MEIQRPIPTLEGELSKALIWSVALWLCQFDIYEKERRKDDPSLWRRVLRVSWRDRNINEWVKETIGGTRERKWLLEMVLTILLKRSGN